MTAQICDTEIKVKEYDGSRVVTFKDIDRVHQRPNGTSCRNFQANRKRFIEGEDYFKISLSEFWEIGFADEIRPQKGNPNMDVVLITESGYLMLVKSFTDELAWRVQRELVKCYFRVKDEIRIEVTKHQELSKEEWLQIGELISKTPKDRLQYLLVVFDRIAPGAFDDFSQNETVVGIQVPLDFGKKLLKTLNSKNITQAEFAKMIGCAKSTISHYVNEKSKPQGKRFQRIVEILDMV